MLPSNQPLCFLLFRIHFNQKLFQILNLKLLAQIFENHSLRKHEGERWELTEPHSFQGSYNPATRARNLSFRIFTTQVSEHCPRNKVLSRWFSTGVILLLLHGYRNLAMSRDISGWHNLKCGEGWLLAFSGVGSKRPETLSILYCKGQPPTNGPALKLASAEAEKPCSPGTDFPLVTCSPTRT